MNFLTFFRRLPLPCPGCGRDDAPSGGNEFCGECLRRLRLFPASMSVCPGCGGPMDGALAVCSLCLAEPERPWREAAALFPYSGYGRELVRQFKFMNRPHLARPLGKLAAELVRRRQWRPDLLTPMPLAWTRRLARGYNQAALLAGIIGGELGIPPTELLKRRPGRAAQATLGRRARHDLRGRFRCSAPELALGRRILLIDDVFTTGATLTAAAAALMRAGAAEILVLTVARTPAFSDFSG